MPPLSIPTRTFRLIPAKSYDGKITQAIPPPPPYHASVRNAIHRNEINQITTQIQQSCSTNVFNVSASSSSTLTTNINAINASSSAVYVNQNSLKRLDKGINETDEMLEQDEMPDTELITSNDFENENEASDRVEADDNEHLHQTEVLSGRISKSNEPEKQQRPKSHPAAGDSANDTINKDARNMFKQEENNAPAKDVDDMCVHDKRGRGLKVLSNVQVSPNAILNVSLNTTNSESIPLNNMIIVSSIPSTSTGTTSQQALSSQIAKSQSLLKNLNETARTPSEARNQRYTKANVEVSVI